ncbi:hypothetical protein [Vreelandella populi]|uniref:STAS domain-containing protein n=1 Tax=Vreelandella populi TaxID=2498858 RepID=A0A433LF51_9GAMM|nr:hypothetical protein [Halomonas populi]RUR35725.1 hypothetical protein ELY25_17210 [Halomonas populi]RUR47916.1 hypothetical protein ELY37_06565 [Halomonas populi]
MSLIFKGNVAHLVDQVTVEDAETLLEWLTQQPVGKVNLKKLEHLHAANLQVLMATCPKVTAWPANPDTRAWLDAALQQS